MNEFVHSGDDRFLGWLHYLVLMDNTAIMATTRERCLEKFRIMCEDCAQYKMVMNVGKTVHQGTEE